MDPKAPDAPVEELEEVVDGDQSDDKTDDTSHGYHKFLAEMVLFNNFHDKLGDEFNPFPKLNLANFQADPRGLLRQARTGDPTAELESQYINNERSDNLLLKALAKNTNRQGDFNINSYLSSRSDPATLKINSEMSDYELDLDFGCHDFQRRFYAKYILTHSGKYRSEQEKSDSLKIKIVISDRNVLYITRSRMDALLTDFKTIYASFCKLRSFLTPTCVKKFDDIFEFSDYCLLNEVAHETMELADAGPDFEVRWRKGKSHTYIQRDDEFTDPAYFKDVLFSYFRKNVFETIRTITELGKLSEEKILAHIVRKNLSFFGYMLKYEKQDKENEIQKEKLKK